MKFLDFSSARPFKIYQPNFPQPIHQQHQTHSSSSSSTIPPEIQKQIQELKSQIEFLKNNNSNERIIVLREKRNPTVNDNYPIGTVFINTVTAEVFICVDNQNGITKWVGSFGTVIEPNPYYKTDFFNDNSIIAFYRFDYSTNDDTGVFNGMKSGSAFYTKGRFGAALDFGNIPNSVNAFMVQDIELSEQMNFSFWVYKHSNNQLNPYISLAYKNIYNGILLFENDRFFKIIINNELRTFRYSQFIPTKEWVFVSLNVDNKLKKTELFINGQFVDVVYYTSNFSFTDNSYNNCLIFGQDQDTFCGGFDTTQSFLGKVDQFRIFRRALLPEEIKTLYQEQP